jgi:hypothetical protein
LFLEALPTDNETNYEDVSRYEGGKFEDVPEMFLPGELVILGGVGGDTIQSNSMLEKLANKDYDNNSGLQLQELEETIKRLESIYFSIRTSHPN